MVAWIKNGEFSLLKSLYGEYPGFSLSLKINIYFKFDNVDLYKARQKISKAIGKCRNTQFLIREKYYFDLDQNGITLLVV